MTTDWAFVYRSEVRYPTDLSRNAVMHAPYRRPLTIPEQNAIRSVRERRESELDRELMEKKCLS